MKLEKELKKWDYPAGACEFREKLAEVFHLLFPETSTERVICSWRASRDFSRAVCRAVQIPCNEETESMVAWELINMRKSKKGKLHLYERERLTSGKATHRRPDRSPGEDLE